MKLDKLFESLNDSMYDPVDDNTGIKMGDTRRAKITLRHLNKLRKYREFKQKEMDQRDAIAAIVYCTPEEDNSGGLSL
jgi:hypothetical protein